MNTCVTGPGERALGMYAAGRLQGPALVPIIEHLASCKPCRELLRGLEPTVAATDQTQAEMAETQASMIDGTAFGGDPGGRPFAHPNVLPFPLRPSADGRSLGRFGDYEIVCELGRGTMGTVLKAFEGSLSRHVAIKVLAPWLAASERGRRRFLREARSAASINHPNVVTIHAVGEQDGTPYLVMEYIAGQSLRERMHEEPALEPTDAMRIGMQVADGLAAAHAQGVIHRDIKPANIMLEDGVGRVKITDFSLALAAMNLAELTSVDHVVGTPAYMAPEQVNAPELVDHRSDLFGLGCVLYAMLAGHSPFKGSHTLEAIRKVCDHVPPPLCEINPAVPEDFSDVVARLLHKDRKDRFQSAAEVAEVLRNQLANANREQALSGSFDEIPKVKGGPPRWRRALLGAVAALAVILLMVAAWKSIHTPSPPSDPPRIPIPGALTVSKGGNARFTSLGEAIRAAGPGSVIRVLDPANYEEAITLDDPELHQGLTIVAEGGATLSAPRGSACVVRITGPSGVTLRGFRIKASQDQHALIIAGEAPGLTIDRVRIDQPAGAEKAAVYLQPGTSGTAKAPITLRHLDLNVGQLGVGIFGVPGRESSSIVLEDCRIKGTGVLVLLDGALRDVSVVGNILRGGANGLNLNLSPPGGSRDILVANNTFYRLRSWICLVAGLDQPGIAVHRNLILEVPEVQAGDADLERDASYFAENEWAVGPGLDKSRAGRVAGVVDEVRIVSTDPLNPDFFRPIEGRTLPAVPGRERPYVGAKAPVSKAIRLTPRG